MTKKFLIILTTALCLGFTTAKQNTEQITVVKQDSQDSLRTELAHEIHNYIKRNFPQSKLSGHVLATMCVKHQFDPVFALAQGQIESGFGTAGKAKHTNSVWNVGACDGWSTSKMKKAGFGFAHPNKSVEPYIVLVKTKYMGEKKTHKDLLRHYVSLSGHRYASSKTYEKKLTAQYNRIKSKTKILKVYNEIVKG